MAPTRNDLMDSNEVDDMICLAQKTANIDQSLSHENEKNRQWLIEDGNNHRRFQMLPPNFRWKALIPHLMEHFTEGLDHKDWFVRLKCCLFLPLALKYRAFCYVKDTGPMKMLKVNITSIFMLVQCFLSLISTPLY